MWEPNEEDITHLIVLAGEKTNAKRTAHYTELAPVLYDVACAWCNQLFDMAADADRKKQSAVKLFIAKAAQYYELKVGLVSRKMGSVAYSFAEEIPSIIYKPLKPYRKVRW
ncbi:hypothetical protein MKX47_12295 [Solibacillus sp. FSL R7-0668]|uniref:hypothetical protein n=1 Tax=Solibacillus sp. FSL R7-0668 TaxID=2921688 RepID=UPI0030FB39F6